MKKDLAPKLELVKDYNDPIDVECTPDVKYALDYLLPMMRDGVTHYIDNVYGTINLLIVDRRWVLPIFIPDTQKDSAYVESLYSHYVRYAIVELRELKNPIVEFFAGMTLRFFGLTLSVANIDRCVYINNWLLSTNLYTDVPAEYVSEISQFIAKEYPRRCVVWSSVNNKTTPDLYQAMKKPAYRLLFSRSIYVYDKNDTMNAHVRNILKREQKLTDTSRYTFSDTFDAEIVTSFYRDLYVEKYSKYNPIFNAKFMQHMYDHNLIEYDMLVDEDGLIVGVNGAYSRNGIRANPVIGYDMSLPREHGLYRLLSYKMLRDSKKRNLILHGSSGVGEFKRGRGAKYAPEYRTVYMPSALWNQRIALFFLEWILNHVAVPTMERRKL